LANASVENISIRSINQKGSIFFISKKGSIYFFVCEFAMCLVEYEFSFIKPRGTYLSFFFLPIISTKHPINTKDACLVSEFRFFTDLFGVIFDWILKIHCINILNILNIF